MGTQWPLVWSDEFDGPAGTPPDPATWQAETGGHGWGNDELQCYTDGGNAALDGNGNLAITVRRTAPDEARFDGCGFTSARLISRDRVHSASRRTTLWSSRAAMLVDYVRRYAPPSP